VICPPKSRPLRLASQQLEVKQKQAEQQRHDAEQKLEAKITADELKKDAASSDGHFLTAEGFTAGYSDNRFIIQSADGNFTWRPWVPLAIPRRGRRPSR